MKRMYVPHAVVSATEEALRSTHADRPHETMVYWAGLDLDYLLVMAAYVPPQSTTPQHVQTSPAANAQYVRWLQEKGLQHVAQVHTHPPGVRGHSIWDDEGAFGKTVGLVSIVVDDYGRQGMLPFERHSWEYCTGDEFLALDADDVVRNVVLVPSVVDARRSRSG